VAAAVSIGHRAALRLAELTWWPRKRWMITLRERYNMLYNVINYICRTSNE
jgi:hypothetical protein